MNEREKIQRVQELASQSEIAANLARIAGSLDQICVLLNRFAVWLDKNERGESNLNIETGTIEVKVHDRKIVSQ